MIQSKSEGLWKTVEYSLTQLQAPIVLFLCSTNLSKYKANIESEHPPPPPPKGGGGAGGKSPDLSWKRVMLQNCYTGNLFQDCILISFSLVT